MLPSRINLETVTTRQQEDHFSENENNDRNENSQLWRSSGPNHFFEIFAPSSISEKDKKSLFSPDLTKKPVFKLSTTTKPVSRIEKHKTGIKGRRIARKKVSHHPGARKGSVRRKERCETPNLETCVDGCTELEDILEYSGCVVRCSEVCKP